MNKKIKLYKARLKAGWLTRCKYLKIRERSTIDEKMVLLESQHGAGVNGNMFYMAREFSERGFDVYVTAASKKRKEQIQTFLENKKISATVVVLHTKKYYRIISSAKYLINDTTFLPFFIKRSDQIYLNTWHGTPLKALGRKSRSDCMQVGNIQKNFIAADYLLYPSEYMRDRMLDNFMVRELSDAEIILSGYPRNIAFFDEKTKTKIKKELELEEKKIYVFMPTWRDSKLKQNIKSRSDFLRDSLDRLDCKMNDDEIMFVKLHSMEKSRVNFAEFDHIFPFPEEYETYEFLNIADVLITDYSSVMFDFAITEKKIVLFCYDQKEYENERSMYMKLDNLPFSKCKTVGALYREMSSPKNYDDKKFIKTFCAYDDECAAEKLVDLLVKNKKDLNISKIVKNDKENVLIYAGNFLAKNGITAAAKGLLSQIDLSKRNYYLYFDGARVQGKFQSEDIPEQLQYYCAIGKMNLPVSGKILHRLYDKQKIGFGFYHYLMKKYYKLDRSRIFDKASFSHVIQFYGYSFRKTLLFDSFSCRKTFFVHSDYIQEAKTKKNQDVQLLKYIYNCFDNIAVVSEDLLDTVVELGGDKEKIHVVPNCIDYGTILKYGNEPFRFFETTTANKSEYRTNKMLRAPGKKFVNIGRFSPEKGQLRLINAFSKLWEEYPGTKLFIAGGYGPLYRQLCNYVRELPCKKDIAIIKSLDQAYSLMRKCDFLVQASTYEGFGLTLLEGDILGLPVMATNITGPSKFMRKYGGQLVESSEEGIYLGMKEMLEKGGTRLNVDYKKYNSNAVDCFEKLFEEAK